MANCRCEDIKMYDRDLERLSSAMTQAQKVIDASTNVDTLLADLKSEYDDTVRATDDFIPEFDNVNKDGTQNARNILTTVKGAHRTVYELKKAACEEDRIYHEELEKQNSSED